jgi:hypothetical protein
MLGVNRVGLGVARGLDIMMPEVIDLKFIAALRPAIKSRKGGKSRPEGSGLPRGVLSMVARMFYRRSR